MMKRTLFKILLLFFIVQNSGCYDSAEIYQGSPYDPSKPVVISNFAPDSGGIRTQVVIEGENFGTDTSKIQFFFGKKKAQLMGLKGEAAYILMPKQPGDLSNLSAVIAGDTIVFGEKQFKYEISASVSAFVGKSKESGGKDGTMQEATFNKPKFVRTDSEGNLFIVESGTARVRLVSPHLNKVITLFTGLLMNQPCPSADDGGKRMFMLVEHGGMPYLFDPAIQWIPEILGVIDPNKIGYYHSMVTIPQAPGYLYTRRNHGNFLRIPTERLAPEKVVDLDNKIGNLTQNAFLVYNPKNAYLYCTLTTEHTIWRAKVHENADIDQFEIYAGGSAGHREGLVEDAEFAGPRTMAVDGDGNVLVADYDNHVIRSISLDGVVSTIAGQAGTAGYADGHPTEEALFKQPFGITIDHDGYIYVAEEGSHCIRKIAIE